MPLFSSLGGSSYKEGLICHPLHSKKKLINAQISGKHENNIWFTHFYNASLEDIHQNQQESIQMLRTLSHWSSNDSGSVCRKFPHFNWILSAETNMDSTPNPTIFYQVISKTMKEKLTRKLRAKGVQKASKLARAREVSSQCWYWISPIISGSQMMSGNINRQGQVVMALRVWVPRTHIC